MKNILIVDDEGITGRLIADILSDAGYNVHIESNGWDALVYARANSIDLIISDMMMPIMSGLELREHLAIDCPALPVILMSASTRLLEAHSGERIYTLGKPFTLDQLLALVGDVLSAGE